MSKENGLDNIYFIFSVTLDFMKSKSPKHTQRSNIHLTLSWY